MPQTLTTETISKIFAQSPAQIEEFFSKWNFANGQTNSFGDVSTEAKIALGEKIAEAVDNEEVAAVLLETIRILSRDKAGIESLMNESLCDKILMFGGLPAKNGFPKSIHISATTEAQKCLINTMFNSQKMRDQFIAHPENPDILPVFLSEFDESTRKTSQFEWIRTLNPAQNAEIWYFYHRIAFIATALNKDLQRIWADKLDMVDHLLKAVELVLPGNGRAAPNTQDLLRANEAMKTFFNVFCHFQGDVPAIDEAHGIKACRILRDVICTESLGEEVIQSAIHCLAVPPLPMVLSVLCVDPKNEKEQVVEGEEHTSMVFTEALLTATEKRLKEITSLMAVAENSPQVSMGTDLLGPYFQTLARLCVESKHVRRYCRLRVIPPLMAEEVQKRPEEQQSMRGMIARIMMLPSATKEVAAEFLFIVCKRSVNRMIKYVGFGHSAGHLANMGLLGQINQPKHASDSEDSETEEYNAVKDSVNPVTGAVYPADRGSAIAGLSEEQKEFEAMKLVDAMNKMMDAGIVKPGTIGEDGKVREVSHVLELIKDAPEPEVHSDSD